MTGLMSKELKYQYQDALVAACGLYDCEGNICLDRHRAEILIAACTDPNLTEEALEAVTSGKPLYPPDHPINIALDKVLAGIEAENQEVARLKRLVLPSLRAAVRGEAPAKRHRPATKLEAGRRILAKLYPDGVPDTLESKSLHTQMCEAGFKGNYSTAMRAAGRRK